MSEPKDLQDLERRFMAAHEVTGYGPEGVTQHMPCPFCAAPEWMVFKIIDVQQAMQDGATCERCGRSARMALRREGGGVSFSLVQTGGPDPPDWYEPKPRREEP